MLKCTYVNVQVSMRGTWECRHMAKMLSLKSFRIHLERKKKGCFRSVLVWRNRLGSFKFSKLEAGAQGPTLSRIHWTTGFSNVSLSELRNKPILSFCYKLYVSDTVC